MGISNFKSFSKDYLVNNYYSKLKPDADPSKDIYIIYKSVTGKSCPNCTPEELRNKLAEMPPSFSVEHDHSHEVEGYVVDTNEIESPEYQDMKEQNKILKGQIAKQREVNEIKQEKLQENEELRKLKEKENEKIAFLESRIGIKDFVEQEKPSQQPQSSNMYRPTPLPQQQSMDLPNIWDFGEPSQKFEEGGEKGDPPPSENEDPFDEAVRQDTLIKQKFADSLYNQFNDPSTRSKGLRKKVVPEDPLYKSLWNPSNMVGYEREVMENYQPSEIYYDPLNPDLTFPVFKHKYEIPKPVISNKVDRLPTKSIETPEISKEITPSKKANINLRTYTDPWSGKQEVMNRSQHLQRQRAHYKGEEKPEVFERGFEDRISGRKASPEQIVNYKQSRPQEYPEFNKNLSKMIGVIGMPKKSINSNLSSNEYKQGGVIESELNPEEIKQYKQRGYIIEELPKAQKGKIQPKKK